MTLVKRLSFYLVFVALFVAGLICFRFPLLSFSGQFLIADERPEKADLIVILSGSNVDERIRYGVKLYQQGFAPQILLEGHMTLEKETGVDLMKHYTQMLGVPEEAILRNGRSQTTVENAQEVKKVVLQKGYRKILLVTSPAHTRRAYYLFRKILPSTVDLKVVSDRLIFPVNSWWQDSKLLREVVYEYLNWTWLGWSRIRGRSL